jgi:hypothetical protein
VPVVQVVAGSQGASASVKAGRLEIATHVTLEKERQSAFGTTLLTPLVSLLRQRTWRKTDKYQTPSKSIPRTHVLRAKAEPLMLCTHLTRTTRAAVITALSVLADLRVRVTGITMAVLAVLKAKYSFTSIYLHPKDVLN